jgi:ketosteroid isomerase-like protein
MQTIDATPLLAPRALPTAGVEDAMALRALFAYQHATFIKALARYDFDQALERWTHDAILWLPERPPVFGRASIRRLLADDIFRTGAPLHTSDLRVCGAEAYESGTCGRGEVRAEYHLVWTLTGGVIWQVSRESWDYKNQGENACTT